MPFVKKADSQGSQLPTDVHKIFIGREGELLFFRQNILKPKDPTYNIVSVSGQGGVGKSALLKRFIEEACKPDFKDYCLMALVDERQTTPASMMEKLADQLPMESDFEKALRQYKDVLHKLQDEREAAREALLRKTTADIAGGIVKDVPFIGGMLQEGVGAATSYLFDELRYRQMLKDAERLEDPVGDLTRAFVSELNRLADTYVPFGSARAKHTHRVILFFDTFEQLAAEAAPWLLNSFLEANISNQVVLVISGRDPLEQSTPDDPKRWLPYHDSDTIYSIALNSFTEEETRVYLEERGTTDPDRIDTIWKLSLGLPLYLGFLTSNLQGTVDPTTNVVANFLRWIPEQEAIKRQLALDAALLSKPFNLDDLEIFSYILEPDRSLLYQWLTKQPFVRSRSQDGRYLYHDVARDLFSRHLYQHSQKHYYGIRRALATYYHERLEKIRAQGDSEVYYSEECLELLLEAIYQMFLLPELVDHIKAIELILNAYEGHTNQEQDAAMARTLRDIVQEPSSHHIRHAARKIAVQLLHYIESDRREDQEWLTASETLLKTIAHAPSFPSELLAGIYLRRGYVYFSFKEYQRAIEDIQQAHALGKKTEGASLTLAYRNLGDRDQSFAYFNRLVTLNSADAWAYDRRGWNYFYFLEHELAIADFDHVLTLDPYSGSAYLGKGWAYYNLREYQQAVTALTRALERDSHLGYAYGCLSLIYQSLKDRQQAALYLDRFVEMDSENSDAYAYRGDFLLDSQEYQQAHVDFNRAITLAPDRSWLYHQRGCTHLWLKNLQQAQADFTRSCELEPTRIDDALMTEWIGMCQEETNPNLPERLDMITSRDPQDYWAYVCRGVEICLRKRFEEALAEIERAIVLNPKMWGAYFWKGMTCASLDRNEEAMAAIEKSLELGLPPVLLVPLHWLEKDRPDFYQRFVIPLFARYELTG